MNEQIWWFLARSSGIVAWALLTASVLWGIVLSTDLFPRNRRPAWLLDLHRWLGGLTCGFLGLHLVTLWADTTLERGDFDTLPVVGGAPRVVVKLLRVSGRYGQSELGIGSGEILRLRFGYHGNETPPELHVVADLVESDIAVLATEVRGKSLEILFGRP